MSKVNKYLELKKKSEAAQKKADEAKGAYDQVMKRLKEDFGCTTLAEAKKKLKSLQNKEQKLTKEFDAAVDTYEEKWENESD
jgi:predicted transcriptional regulator